MLPLLLQSPLVWSLLSGNTKVLFQGELICPSSCKQLSWLCAHCSRLCSLPLMYNLKISGKPHLSNQIRYWQKEFSWWALFPMSILLMQMNIWCKHYMHPTLCVLYWGLCKWSKWGWGNWVICTFPCSFGVHPLTLPRGGQKKRPFYSTGQVPVLGGTELGYWALVLVWKFFDNTIREKGFTQKGIHRNRSYSETQLVWIWVEKLMMVYVHWSPN